jgi:hypothetical protein
VPAALLTSYRRTEAGIDGLAADEVDEEVSHESRKFREPQGDQVRSAIGSKPKQRGTLRALGLAGSVEATFCRTVARSGA